MCVYFCIIFMSSRSLVFLLHLPMLFKSAVTTNVVPTVSYCVQSVQPEGGLQCLLIFYH